MKKNGIVRSIQGKHGGYLLNRAPKDITLGEVIRIIDGPLAPIGTKAEIEKRIQTNDLASGLYSVLLSVRDAISDILDKYTLADACEKSLELAQSKKSHQMYYI